MKRLLLGLIAIGIAVSSISAADGDKKMDRETLEKAFAARMTGASLSGAFSVDGKEMGGPNKPDKYQIKSAKKVAGDDWEIVYKAKVGEAEIDLPIRIKVYWADDTPVMSLTDFTIPGVGTFTARVMFYGDRYAGTWQHGKVGGHMWGIVEKAAEKTPDNKAPEK